MNIAQAQHDVRTTFLGGFAGQLVSGILWLISAALATFVAENIAILFLLIAGAAIFPLTQLTLRLMGHNYKLPTGHPMNGLAMQVAFVLPLILPLVIVAVQYRPEWFYPAFMIALGAHYLPFIFLYGMPMFGPLAAILIGAGVLLGLYGPDIFSLGGWFTGMVLLIFAVVGRSIVLRENTEAEATA